MAPAGKTPRKIVATAAITPDYLDRLDEHARALGRSRSELIDEAVRLYVYQLDGGL